MSRSATLFHYGILVIMGAGWGLTIPLSKIAVSTGHGEFGLIFWQMVIGALLMAGVIFFRGGVFRPGWRAVGVCVLISLTGSIIPDAVSYRAYVHLPAGVMSILLSLIPMMAFPIALSLGVDRFSFLRFAGLLAGLAGVLVLIIPEASLPDRAMLGWIVFALIAPLCYAFEGNYVAKWGIAGLGPVEVLFGASLIGAVITLPLALGSGQFINPIRVWAAPEWALLASAAIHVVVYAGYVWLVRQAGSVFAVQVSYLVTGFGVAWAMALLGETYSHYIWAALALVMTGVFLVQPRPGSVPGSVLEPAGKAGQDIL